METKAERIEQRQAKLKEYLMLLKSATPSPPTIVKGPSGASTRAPSQGYEEAEGGKQYLDIFLRDFQPKATDGVSGDVADAYIQNIISVMGDMYKNSIHDDAILVKAPAHRFRIRVGSRHLCEAQDILEQ
ncbi:hypothetical protein N9L19_00295 [bacterium]|nr:hypothetical protein [bacterium]